MRTERTRDRIILSPIEVQIILREHIERESGRKIYGEVNFQRENSDTIGPKTSVYVHLQHSDEVENA
jgi:hypothetical protein